MFRPRIIPVLLLKNQVLVKSIAFNPCRYIGDPINAVKLFNDLRADELVFLDIMATKENRSVSIDFVKKVGDETNMPFAVGGGIKTINEIKQILNAGAEKVILCTNAALNPEFVREAANTFGSSTIVVCIDVKKKIFKGVQTWIKNGKESTGFSPEDFAKLMEEKGAGEIIIQSIERDGMMTGYDVNLVKKISETVSIPVVALGGAGNLAHLKEAYTEGFANGLGAGSFFVFKGQNKGVLINYPEKHEIISLFS